MIIGTGVDVVEKTRIAKAYKSSSARFPQKILSTNELEKFNLLLENKKIDFLSKKFAAKEAVAKAIGFGLGGTVKFTDISINKDEFGKPELEISETIIIAIRKKISHDIMKALNNLETENQNTTKTDGKITNQHKTNMQNITDNLQHLMLFRLQNLQLKNMIISESNQSIAQQNQNLFHLTQSTNELKSLLKQIESISRPNINFNISISDEKSIAIAMAIVELVHI